MNTGCIPSKFLLTLAEYSYYKNHGHTGVRMDSSFDLAAILAEKNTLIERLKQKKTDRIITGLDIEILQGNAEFLSPTNLQIGDWNVTADRVIIATGSSPVIPPVREYLPSHS